MYGTGLSFTLTDLKVTMRYRDFSEAICASVCGLFCVNSSWYIGMGYLYSGVFFLSVILTFIYAQRSAANLFSSNNQGNHRYDAWILGLMCLLCVSVCTLNTLKLPETGEMDAGLICGYISVVLTLGCIGHLCCTQERKYRDLQHVRVSELEGTHVDPTRPREDNQYSTEPASDEKKAIRQQKELLSLKEQLDSEENARKTLQTDNQQLLHQLENREKSIRELEQKLGRSHQNVQVTAALSVAKQKEEEVLRLIGRLRDAEERVSVAVKRSEELTAKVRQLEAEKTASHT